MDLYHVQIVEGDLARKIHQDIKKVGHFQIAGVPGRHERDIGEINYSYLYDLIDELGFDGWIGCEYRPEADGISRLRPGTPGFSPLSCRSHDPS